MESPRNKMIGSEDIETKKNKSQVRRQEAMQSEVVTDPNNEVLTGGLKRFFFPTLQKSVVAESREEAEAIINKEVEK